MFGIERPEFPLPADLAPIGRRCIVVRIPDDNDWVRTFNGVLMMLQYWFNYERDDDKRGTLVAQLWREVLQDICWKGGVVRALRQKPGNPNMLQWLDCDDVWNDAFDFGQLIIAGTGDSTGDALIDVVTNNQNVYNQYDGDITNIWPEINDVNDDFRNLAWCGGLTILVDALCAGAIAAIAASDENEAQRRLAIAAAIGTALAAGLEALSLVVAPESVLAAVLARRAIQLALASAITAVVSIFIPDPTPPDYAPYQSSTAKENVVCCVYDAISVNDDVEQTQFNDAFAGCPFDEGTDEYKIQQVCIAATQDLMTFLNFATYVKAIYDATVLGIAFACPCSNWCYLFDFEIDNTWWYAAADWTQGHYQAGLGWTSNDESHANAGRRAVRMEVEAGNTVVEKVTVNYAYTKGTIAADYTAFFIEIGGFRVMEKRYSQMVNGTGQTLEWTGSRTTNDNGKIRVFMSSSLDTSNPYTYSGAILITSIEAQGSTYSPFGDDNCMPD